MAVAKDTFLSLSPQQQIMSNKAPKYKAPFDTQLYSIHPDMIQMFKINTGIVDDEVLKKHLIEVSRDAFSVRVFSAQKIAYGGVDG